MKKCQRLTAAVALTALVLTGCQTAKIPDDVGRTTVAIGEDGQIRYWLVGAFDKDYYQLSELTEMAVEEAKEFNDSRIKTSGEAAAKAGTPVKVENVEMLQSGSEVMVQYIFDGWQSYTGFGEEHLFWGTPDEAKRYGYGADVELYSVKDESVYSSEAVQGAKDGYFVITDVKADVYCPGRVTHMSEGAVLNEDGSVDTTGAEGLVYILLK